MLAIDRDTFIAAIEAGIEASVDRNLRVASGERLKRHNEDFLTKADIDAVRELGRTAEYVTLRSFNFCPLAQIGVRRNEWDWGFIDAYDDYVDIHLGLMNPKTMSYIDAATYPQNAKVVIE